MSLYERYPLTRAVKTDMPDLPMKPRSAPAKTAPTTKRKPVSSASKSPRRRSTATRSQTAKTKARLVKSLPPLGAKQTEQPRDRFGRFARKTGAVLWTGTKIAAKATHKAAKSTHRAIKRSNAASRRRRNLELRERTIALREREARLRGGSKRKSGKATRKPRKQGFLSQLFGGRRK